MTTIRLRNNAFDESQETFLTVNIDEEKKRIAKQGIEDGRKNLPAAQATGMSELEYGIVEQIKQTAQQTHQALARHFTGFSARLTPFEEILEPQAKINGINDVKNNMKQELEDEINNFDQEGIIKKGKWQDAEKSYEQFRQENRLTRSASYSPWQSGIILLSILIVEAALNAFLLIDFVGWLPAFGQTVLITAVNVVIGAAIVGLFWRYKNITSWKLRWLASISVPFFLLVLIFNFGVGHYRDALTEVKSNEGQNVINWDTFDSEPVDYGFVDYTIQAMDRFKSSPFGIDSVLSVLLIVIGIGCFAGSTYKWYSMLDPCPGYMKRDVERNLAHKQYTELIKTVGTKIDRTIKAARDKVADERVKTVNIRSQRADLINRAETLQNNYITWISTLATQQTRLMRLYQDRNLETRSEPPPAYFGTDTPINGHLTQPPDFTPQDATNVEKIVQAAEDARAEVDRVADAAGKKFRELADVMSESVDPERGSL